MESKKHGFGQALSQFEFAALQGGKHCGFTAAYQMYADYVFSLALHVVKDRQVAQDVMQSVFETLLLKSTTVKCAQTLGAWLKQCTINACLTYFRRNKNLHLTVDFDTLPEDSKLSNEQETGFSEGNSEASQSLARLPLMQRSVVYLYSVVGLRHSEIAENLNINEGYSRQSYSRALRKLKSWLNNSGYQND